MTWFHVVVYEPAIDPGGYYLAENVEADNLGEAQEAVLAKARAIGAGPLEVYEALEVCCRDYYGGSHYHCARCFGVSSMLGHTTNLHPPKDGSRRSIAEWDRVESHFCCPGDCELGTR